MSNQTPLPHPRELTTEELEYVNGAVGPHCVNAGFGAVAGAITARRTGTNILRGAALGAATGLIGGAYGRVGNVISQQVSRTLGSFWNGLHITTFGFGSAGIIGSGGSSFRGGGSRKFDDGEDLSTADPEERMRQD